MVPFLNLKASYRQSKLALDAAVSRDIERTQFVLGPEVAALDKRIAAFDKGIAAFDKRIAAPAIASWCRGGDGR